MGGAGSDSPLAVQPIEIEPLVPVLQAEMQPRDIVSFNLQSLMDYMVTQVTKVQWKEQKESMQLKCFQFLFEEFKRVYIGHIFPRLDMNYSLYKDAFELPGTSNEASRAEDLKSFAQEPHLQAKREAEANAKAVVIRWLGKYLSNEVEVVPRRGSFTDNQGQRVAQPPTNMLAGLGASGGQINESYFYSTEWREPTPFEFDIVRSTLNANRDNVNLTHELFRQAFLLPFSQSLTIRRVISVYKDWINKNTSEVPLFLEEPNSDSDQDVRVGSSKVLRAFITNAANIFLMYVPPDRPLLLEEQVDMCKRILNLYRFMVMKVDMDKETWEQLLYVMLRITGLVLTEVVPLRKEDTLGGRLAPAFFQVGCF